MHEVRRSADRFRTEGPGAVTRHSFSHGRHYDPANVSFGPLVALNVEEVPPGGGYDAHPHADVEIVTWVLDGALAHRDTTGRDGVIGPGVAQRLSAGSGVEHTERNASATEPLRFVQMMLASRHHGDPEYASAAVPQRWGEPVTTVSVAAPAELSVLWLRPGQRTELVAGRLLLHVTRGALSADGDRLEAGDELRLDGSGLVGLQGIDAGEALIWRLAGG